MIGLDFDHARHQYRLDGLVVPGVTTLLRSAMNFSCVPADVIAEALRRGTDVHKAVELDVQGRLDESTVDAVVAPYLVQFRKWRRQTRFQPTVENGEVTGAERKMASRLYGFAGTGDLDGCLPDVPAAQTLDLIDVKTKTTPGSLPVIVGPQTAAYAQMLREHLALPASWTIRRWCLLLTPTCSRLSLLSSATDWPVFASALTLWRWCHANKLV